MEAQDYVVAIRAHGLTQAQIAEKTGIPQPTISKIERGDVADVMSKNYRALQALHGHLEATKATGTGKGANSDTLARPAGAPEVPTPAEKVA